MCYLVNLDVLSIPFSSDSPIYRAATQTDQFGQSDPSWIQYVLSVCVWMRAIPRYNMCYLVNLDVLSVPFSSDSPIYRAATQTDQFGQSDPSWIQYVLS